MTKMRKLHILVWEEHTDAGLRFLRIDRGAGDLEGGPIDPHAGATIDRRHRSGF